MTLTSKGQMTLPIAIRQQMNLKEGDQLQATYNPDTQIVQLSKPLKLEDLAEEFGKLIKPGTMPVTDASEYYQAHRQPRV